MGIEVREGDIAGAINATNTPRPGLYVAEFLVNGASADMNVDGSGTPVVFQKSPPSGKTWHINMVSICIEDQSINFSKFGGEPALTNGVTLKVKEGGEVEKTIGLFKRNGDAYIFTNDVRLESASSDILVVHANILDNTGTTWELKNSNSEVIKLTVNDNLTGLIKFRVLIRGYEVDE